MIVIVNVLSAAIVFAIFIVASTVFAAFASGVSLNIIAPHESVLAAPLVAVVASVPTNPKEDSSPLLLLVTVI